MGRYGKNDCQRFHIFQQVELKIHQQTVPIQNTVSIVNIIMAISVLTKILPTPIHIPYIEKAIG